MMTKIKSLTNIDAGRFQEIICFHL